MNRNGRTALSIVAGAAALLVALTGCGKHHASPSASAAAASAKATASAILHSGTATSAEQAAVNSALACGVTAKAINQVSDVTYTLNPVKVTSANTTTHLVLHPGKTTTAFTNCMKLKYQGDWPKIRNCVQANPPALGHGFFSRLIESFVTCTAKYAGGKK